MLRGGVSAGSGGVGLCDISLQNLPQIPSLHLMGLNDSVLLLNYNLFHNNGYSLNQLVLPHPCLVGQQKLSAFCRLWPILQG